MATSIQQDHHVESKQLFAQVAFGGGQEEMAGKRHASPCSIPSPNSCSFPPFPQSLVYLPLPPFLRVPDFLHPWLTSATTCLCNHTAENGHGLPHQEVMQIIINATPLPHLSPPPGLIEDLKKGMHSLILLLFLLLMHLQYSAVEQSLLW